MTDTEVLKEISSRLRAWLFTGVSSGWAEENYGFRVVLEWVEELPGMSAEDFMEVSG